MIILGLEGSVTLETDDQPEHPVSIVSELFELTIIRKILVQRDFGYHVFYEQSGVENLLGKLVLAGVLSVQPLVQCDVFNVREQSDPDEGATGQVVSTESVCSGLPCLFLE